MRPRPQPCPATCPAREELAQAEQIGKVRSAEPAALFDDRALADDRPLCQSDAKMAPKAAAAPAPLELQLLVLSGGMSGAELAKTLEDLKEKSKGASTHKRRELYWNAYGQMISKTSSIEGPAFCFLTYKATAEGEDGTVELIELTKRQRGLVGGQVDFLGHKIKPLGPDGKPDAAAKTWALAFSEEEAASAWSDINHGEPAIVISADGVYVATKHKRVQCKGLSGLPKSGKDVEALVAELQPDKPRLQPARTELPVEARYALRPHPLPPLHSCGLKPAKPRLLPPLAAS